MVRRSTTRVNAIAIAELMVGLQDGCHSMIELADMSGLSINTVRNYCKQLHKRGAIHITDWSEDAKGGRTLKVFELGLGDDMPKPKRQSSAESCAKYRAKQRQHRLHEMMAFNSEATRAAA